MEFEIKKLDKSEIQITITVSAEDMEKHRSKAIADITKDIKVKGFRPGHVPAHVLEEHVDKKYIEAHAQDIAIQRAYADVVIKENLQVVSRPKVKIEKDEPLTFTATVAVMPEVEVKDYKSIKIKKQEVKVTEKDVEEVINDMKRYGTTYKEVDTAAKKGDRVEVDFEGFDGGVAVEGTKSSNHPVILGENSLIPGFEDEIVGLKKDEKKEFNITFPKDYGKESFQGRKLKFKVEVKMVEEATIPELTDELIEKLTGQKKTVKEFKEEVETNVKAKKEQESKQKHENEYIEELLKRCKVEIPEALIEEEAEYILEEMRDEIGQKGLEFAKFLEQAKTTEDDLRKKYRPEAERRIKIRLALQYLIKEEDVQVTEEERQEELERVKSFYPEDQKKKIEEEFTKGNLGITIANRIALKKLFEKVLG